MKLFNNTQNAANYWVSSADGSACGQIAANETVHFPQWNKTQNVKVEFASTDPTPPGLASPFTLTIPKTGTGMAVTIGLYQE